MNLEKASTPEYLISGATNPNPFEITHFDNQGIFIFKIISISLIN